MTKDGAPPPEWLSDFDLAKALGAQTHTTTYRARRRHDDRRVLLRASKAQRRAKAVREAMARESEVLRAVDHPAIPALLDVVQSGDRIALVIEDHGGHRLDAVIERLPKFPATSALAIALEVADALAAVHRLHEPHGSLRLELVELTEQGMVYLHGVGQRHVRALVGADEELAQPEHMAPEQLLGDPPDEQTDIFLFGMVLHHMLTGEAPFGAEADEGGDSVSHRIRHAKPTSMGDVLPEGLERVVRRCLEKRSIDRYPDMTTVSTELVRILRRHTALPRDLLVTRALAAAGLADELPPPRERGAERGTSRVLPGLRYVVPALAVVFAVGLGVTLWGQLGDAGSGASTDPRGIVKRPARVQILAHPWAEVHLDGELLDVTPIGQPVEVSPGRHNFVFRHPYAPEETRSIEIIAGQTILLDVAMRITRPDDAGAPQPADAGADALPPSP